jgi:hypothetical protein
MRRANGPDSYQPWATPKVRAPTNSPGPTARPMPPTSRTREKKASHWAPPPQRQPENRLAGWGIPEQTRGGYARSSVGQSSCLLSRNRPSSPVFPNRLKSPPQRLPPLHLIPTHREKAPVWATSIRSEYQIAHRPGQLPIRHLPERACGRSSCSELLPGCEPQRRRARGHRDTCDGSHKSSALK